MDRADAQSFIGIMVPRQQASDLGRLQSALRSNDGRFEPIPQRWLNLTLDHLGPVDPAALEAAALACTRMAATHPPFTLRSGGLRQLGSVVGLMIDDPQGRLAQLRAALHAQLEAYGFELDPRPFMPHIALGRGAPALNVTAPTLAFKINTVRMLTHVPQGVPGLAWRVRWAGDLATQPQAPAEVVDPQARDAEIRAALEARVAARAVERAALRERQARAPKPKPRPEPEASPQRRRSRGERSERDRDRDRSSNRGARRRSQSGSPERPANGQPTDRGEPNAPRKRRRRRRRSGRGAQQSNGQTASNAQRPSQSKPKESS